MIDLAPAHLEEIQQILAEHVPDCEVRAFGSRATWTAKDYSDLDLAVVGTGSLGALALDRLRESFEESALPIRVDVIDWDNLTDSFREAIDEDCVVLQEPTLVGGWRQVTLGQVVEINPKRTLKRGDGAPFVAMADVLEHQRELPEVGVREFKGGGSRFRNDDTLLARITPCLENGKTAWVSGLADGEVGHGSTEFIVLAALEGITDPLFVYYLARQPHFREFAIGQMTGTSGRQRVPVPAIESYEFGLPPLDEQQRIAHILGTLDDKIELNRRMSETLEAMAQALFKSWFVDFDPVRAKAEGRTTGLPPDLDALFPNSFQDSELGEIPEGWEVGTVNDMCSRIENGGTPKRNQSDYWNGTIDWFKTGELSDGPLLKSEEQISDLGLAESSCKLWPRGTVLIALYASPTVGRLGILERPAAANQACSALQARPEYGELLVFHTLFQARERLQTIAVGAAQQNISQQIVRDCPIIIPDSSVARVFRDIASPLYGQQVANVAEVGSLADVRDALLPQLIVGIHAPASALPSTPES